MDHGIGSSSLTATPQKRPLPSDNVSSAAVEEKGKESKIRRIEHEGAEGEQRTTSQPQSPGPPLPTIPYIYHLALQAHFASHQHLQQAFVPADIGPTSNTGEGIKAPLGGPGEHVAFKPDPQAWAKSVSLLLFALDLLKLGLASKLLSDRERVAFGHEFGVVALKVLSAARHQQSKSRAWVDEHRLSEDAAEIIGNSLTISQRYPYMKLEKQKMELLSIKLYVFQGKLNAAKRILRITMKNTESDEIGHRCALMLLLIEVSDGPEALAAVEDMTEAGDKAASFPLSSLATIIRLRLLVEHRQWDRIPKACVDLEQRLGGLGAETHPEDVIWKEYLEKHLPLYRALWEGRSGDDAAARVSLKTAYKLLDQALEDGSLLPLRANGGVVSLRMPATSSGTRSLLLQVTPPNITYLVAYLSTIVSRRDVLGKNDSCRNLYMARAMCEHAESTRANDMWDISFSPMHAPLAALDVQGKVNSIRMEVMLEIALTHMYRGFYREAKNALEDALSLSRRAGILDRYAPQISLLFGQMAHFLGHDSLALSHYSNCTSLLVPGSELGLIVEICALACNGRLVNLAGDLDTSARVRKLAERCRASSNADLAATGHFMGSLVEANRIASKKKLSTAYEVATKAVNSVMKCLIFAFTTSTHHYGPANKIRRQLETGRDLAKLMGGLDQPDGVGQLALGLWFSEKLKESYRQEGESQEYAKTKALQKVHLKRLEEQKGLCAELLAIASAGSG